ncbi:MAG: hypothetical protein F6K58_06255 [Symploca sp. SIO2E9]|nr:hypothetical protein [Symploca sp. SIO2E9]
MKIEDSIIPKMPYKGLDSYDEEDADIFFGRDEEVQEILDSLLPKTISIVYGPTGVGKSSILKAGVIKELNIDSRKRTISIYFDKWEGNVLEKLLSKINTKLINRFLDHDQDNAMSLSSSLIEVLNFWEGVLIKSKIDSYLCLILDQFSNYFRSHKEDNINTDRAFIQEFANAVKSCHSGRVNFIIAITSSEYFKIVPFLEDIRSSINVIEIPIKNLDLKSAREAIEKPVDQYNNLVRKYRQNLLKDNLSDVKPVHIGDGLVERILGVFRNGKDDGNQRGVAAPYLQIIMTTLWREEMRSDSSCLTVNTFREKLKGRQGVLSTYLNDRMDSLTVPEQDDAERIFQYLVTPSHEKRSYSIRDLAEYTRVDKTKLDELLLKLTGWSYRILRPVRASEKYQDEIRYEIFLEILAPGIHNWYHQHSQNRQKIQELPLISRDQSRHKQAELGALLARQAYLFRKQGHNLELSQIDEAFREALVGHQFSTVLEGHEKEVSSVAISPDGKWLASGSHDCTVILWNLEKSVNKSIGKKLKTLKEHKFGVLSVAFSPDGKWLASSEDDYSLDLNQKNKPTIKLWDLEQLKNSEQCDYTPKTLTGHEEAIRTVTFSPNSQIIASGSKDKTVRLWDLNGNLLIEPLQFGGKVNAVSFSPDGNRLAAGGDEKEARSREDKKLRVGDLINPIRSLLSRFGLTKFLFSKLDPIKFSFLSSSRGSNQEVSCVTIWELYDSSESTEIASKPR